MRDFRPASNQNPLDRYEVLKTKDPVASMEKFGVTWDDVESILAYVKQTFSKAATAYTGIRAESYGPLLFVSNYHTSVLSPKPAPTPKCRVCKVQPDDPHDLLLLWFLNLDFSLNPVHRANESMMRRISVCLDRDACRFRMAVR